MRRREGPSKRLAPCIKPESSCPHRFSEDEGLQLEVECIDCAGAHDLSNGQCMAGVITVVSGGAVPDSVILKRFTHKRYRRDAVRIVAAAANELAALNRALASVETPSDKVCRTCPSSRQQVILLMKRRLLEDPVSYVKNGSAMLEELRRPHASISCARASACVESGLSVSMILGDCE
jgi:hypothetical protein